MAGGRPGRDLNALAEALRKWCKIDDIDHINLNGFAHEMEINAEQIMVYARENPEFSQAYKDAKAALSRRREKMLSTGQLHQAAYNRNAKVYDLFLKAEEREEKEFDAAISAGQQTVDAATVANTLAVMAQITNVQAKARKAAPSKSKTDCKS